jgi:hypothetical protein
LTQSIDAAAMDLYIGYKHFDVDVKGAAGGAAGAKASQDFQAVVMGGIIRF